MRIIVSVSTNRVGSKTERTIDIDDIDLEDVADDERDKVIEDIARETLFDMIDWNWRTE